MKITYKQNGLDKDVWCNGAKTRLTISRTTYSFYKIFLDDTELTEGASLEDAKWKVERILNIGIGRDWRNEE